MTQDLRQELPQQLSKKKVLNRQDLLSRVNNDSNILEKILAALVRTVNDNLSQVVDDMEQAVQQRDNDTLRKKAHYLKGMAANASATRLSCVAEKLQLSAEAGAGEDSVFLLETLRQEIDLLKKELS